MQPASEPHVRSRAAFWSRVFTHIPTPTTDDGESVDERRLRRVIDYQIEHGVHGICVLGSTGGNGSFSDEEMRNATDIAARHAAGRISVVAGTGARTTSALIRAVQPLSTSARAALDGFAIEANASRLSLFQTANSVESFFGAAMFCRFT